MNKKIIIILITFAICFVLNLLRHSQILIAFIHSLLLSLSMAFFLKMHEKRDILRYFCLITLSFIPLFQYSPKQFIIDLLPFILLIIWFIQEKLSYKKQSLLIGIFLMALLALISSNMIKPPFVFNTQQTIFSMQEVSKAIDQHQHDGLYVPFRLRPLIYNDSVYIYFLFTRLADFLSLRTLYDILLIANLYPLFWGLYLGMKNPRSKEVFAYIGILITLITIGMNKSPDKFNSFYSISPFLIYFILLGLERVNTKVYLLLVAFSLLIFTGIQL